MCYLCLQDFEFEVPAKPTLEHKKKRLLKVKSLLQLAYLMSMVEDSMDINEQTLCESKVEELKEEQYRLSREF